MGSNENKRFSSYLAIHSLHKNEFHLLANDNFHRHIKGEENRTRSFYIAHLHHIIHCKSCIQSSSQIITWHNRTCFSPINNTICSTICWSWTVTFSYAILNSITTRFGSFGTYRPLSKLPIICYQVKKKLKNKTKHIDVSF